MAAKSADLFNIAVLGCLLAVGCGGSDNTEPDAATSADAEESADAAVDAAPLVRTKLTISGSVATGGIFDPAVSRDPATGTLWMSYSAVNASAMWPAQNKVAPHTRLASSTDGGETWTDAGAVNAISDVELPLTAPYNAGTWMNEVSTLAYDPGAPTNERWKLVWHTFMKINGAPRFEHSWVAVKMAATPSGLASATATKLFTSFLYDVGNDSASAPTEPPLPMAAAIQIDTAFSQLSTCIVSEPSLYATSSALYLALQCEELNDPANMNDNDRRIMLMKCASPCDMTDVGSWTFVGDIFDKAASAALEPTYNAGYAAPALAETSSGVHLIVTPTETADAIYRGCRAFEFADLDTATLESTNGTPTIVGSLAGSTADKFNGACAYIAGSTSGMLHSELSQLPDGEFQIFMSRLAL